MPVVPLPGSATDYDDDDLLLVQINVFFSCSLVFLFQILIRFRDSFGRSNVARKTLVDERFLIWLVSQPTNDMPFIQIVYKLTYYVLNTWLFQYLKCTLENWCQRESLFDFCNSSEIYKDKEIIDWNWQFVTAWRKILTSEFVKC